MRVANWKAKEVFSQIREEAIAAVIGVMDDVAAAAKARCPVGTVTRSGDTVMKVVSFTPQRGRGKGQPVSFMAKQWTGREPGSLRDSIRRVLKPDRPGNVRVYAGNAKVFYAHMVEYGTKKMGPRPFMRFAFREKTGELIAKIEKGIHKVPEVKK